MAAAALAITAAACSPSLNWRSVSLEGLQVLLPCKPDHGERSVQLGAVDTVLRMSGCEASGALYAVSHIRVVDPAQVLVTQSAWRQATLAAIQVAADAPPASPTSTPASPQQLAGKRPDGSPIQAQFVWLSKGQDLYQVAVYATHLDKEKTELLFSELRLQ